MVLADIILLAFVTVFSTGALYIVTAFIVYKLKNRGKNIGKVTDIGKGKGKEIGKGYVRNSLVKTVTSMLNKPVNKIDQRKNIPEQSFAYAYENQRPVMYVQSSEPDLGYNDFYVKQNLQTPHQSKPKLKRPAPKREIRFN